jgi:YHS domain-containing protein
MQLQNVLYYLVWAGLFFVMMRFGCGAHVMGHGHHHGGTGPGNDPRWAPPDQATDPVCGMTVKTAEAKSAVHDGHVFYFCSQTCREKFEAAPASYVNQTGASQRQGEHHG